MSRRWPRRRRSSRISPWAASSAWRSWWTSSRCRCLSALSCEVRVRDDAARSVLVGRGRLWWRSVLLLGPQVFDTLADRRAAIEEVQGDAGGLGL